MSGRTGRMDDDYDEIVTRDNEYSPEFQDEYRRLWHEAEFEVARLRAALEKIAHTDEVRLTETPAQIAAKALDHA